MFEFKIHLGLPSEYLINWRTPSRVFIFRVFLVYCMQHALLLYWYYHMYIYIY